MQKSLRPTVQKNCKFFLFKRERFQENPTYLQQVQGDWQKIYNRSENIMKNNEDLIGEIGNQMKKIIGYHSAKIYQGKMEKF